MLKEGVKTVEFIAHINKDGNIQTVAEHCRGTAELAKKNLCELGLSNISYLSGLLHDAGKCTNMFCDYIKAASMGENVQRGSVIHTFAAVRYLLNTYHSVDSVDNNSYSLLTSEIISSAVGGHHGLFDCFDENRDCGFTHRINKQSEYDDTAMSNFLNEVADDKDINILFQHSVEEISSKVRLIGSIQNISKDEIYFYLSLLTRLVTSALIDADRCDTSSFMNSNNYIEENNSLTVEMLQKLTETLNLYLSSFKRSTPIQVARSDLSEICVQASAKKGGIYKLNLPTGAGKTLSGLRYALKHAEIFGKKRIFFISPLLSILEQNAEEIRKAIKNDSIILEHHSDIIKENFTKNELNQYELLCDTWNSPIIITTLVQFLNTLFNGKTTSIRRFHSLINSVIVIDEVQTVPLKVLSLFNSAINFLSEVCNATVILCSATQPCLEKINHPLRDCKNLVEPDVVKKYDSVFKRNSITDKGRKYLNEIPQLIAELFSKYRSVLVVCNKKEQSSTLFELVKNMQVNTYHLSAGMCVAHRKATLSEITDVLSSKQDDKVLCISTQVIEAGVDISFDAVIRFNAGIDSIVQSAGRCNRNGKCNSDAPVWIVECIDENLSMLEDIRDAKSATDSLLYSYRKDKDKYDSNIASDKSVEYFYKKLYTTKTKDYFDFVVDGYPSIYSLLAQNKNYAERNKEFYLCQAFKTAGELFEVFDQQQISVIVPWGKGKEIIEKLISSNKMITKELYDKIKPYTVSVFSYQLERLSECGAIISVSDGQLLILNKEYYDNNTGIKIPKKGEKIWNTLIL